MGLRDHHEQWDMYESGDIVQMLTLAQPTVSLQITHSWYGLYLKGPLVETHVLKT